MDIHEAICDPHNLTPDRLLAFSQYAGLVAENPVIRRIALTDVVNTAGGDNRLTTLDYVRRRRGVYAFHRSRRIIYVGRSGGGDQDLKTRIGQQLRAGDPKGGTLPKNWGEKHRLDPREHEAIYKAQIAQCGLWTVAFRNDADMQKISRLEHLLIGVLGPEYCK